MRIAVLGVGLIGGSIGLGARERLDAQVIGYDPDPAVGAEALRHGAVDRFAATLAETVAGAQAVFVAAPVGRLAQVVGETLDAAGPGCVISDVGSTKRTVARAFADERFVGGHPLAGAETTGVAHARADLFEGATWYLTPGPRASGVLYERLHRLITGLGAQPAAIEADAHDRLMASVSHLPHVLSNVLVAQAARALGEGERMPATGPSFRDATRVAGASSRIWTDIYLANRDALMSCIDDTVARLRDVRTKLQEGDGEALAAWNDAARADRRALLETGLAGGAVHELHVSVPNRPGVLADIALSLGRAGVNIVDMALSPSPDNRQGVVALWVRGDEHASRALDLIGSLSFAVTRA